MSLLICLPLLWGIVGMGRCSMHLNNMPYRNLNYFDFNQTWLCPSYATVSASETNFPRHLEEAHFLSDSMFENDRNWTTAKLDYGENEKHDESYSGRKLVRFWRDPSHAISFRIKPTTDTGDLRDSMIVIQLFGDLLKPFGKEEITDEDNDHAFLEESKKMHPYQKDLNRYKTFNCFIQRTRQLDLRHLNNALEEMCEIHNGECVSVDYNITRGECAQAGVGPIAYIQKVKDMNWLFPCYRGTKIPQCCYSNLFYLENKEDQAHVKETAKIISSRLDEVYEHDAQSINDCHQLHHHRHWPHDVPKHCDIPEELTCQSELRLIKENDPTCNPFFWTSIRSCLTDFGSEWEIRPCKGRCLHALVVNLEITPGSRDGKIPSRTMISMVYNIKEIDQFYFRGMKQYLTQSSMDFSQTYPVQESETRNTEYTKVNANVDLGLKIGEKTGLWLKWIRNHIPPEECRKKLNITRNVTAPALLVGKEGSAKPLLTFDFLCADFKGVESGFQYGWLGVDIQKPRMKDVWKPGVMGINGIKGSTFEVEMEVFDTRYCRYLIKYGHFPVTIALSFTLAIGFAISALVIVARERLREMFLRRRTAMSDSME